MTATNPEAVMAAEHESGDAVARKVFLITMVGAFLFIGSVFLFIL